MSSGSETFLLYSFSAGTFLIVIVAILATLVFTNRGLVKGLSARIASLEAIVERFQRRDKDMEAFNPELKISALLSQMFGLMTEAFSLEELRDIAFDSGIEPESIEGRSRNAFARELVTKASRMSVLPALITACRDQRPNVEWPNP